MKAVLWHPEAYAELVAAVAYYEGERPGLGDEFLAEVDRSVEAFRESPHRWPMVSDRSHRIRTDRFPYGLVYQVGPAAVRLIAVVHLHRRPAYWRDREA